MEKEIWKDIPGYEGMYQVSDRGNVKSLDREVIYKDGCVKFCKGTPLKARIGSDKRLRVGLHKESIKKLFSIHSLVALTFIGKRPEDYQVCHIDGNCTNNKLSNIRYDIQSQNQIDMYRQGGKCGRGKLSIEQVLEIRKLYATGNYKQTELSIKFNISTRNIRHVVNKETFAWLNDDGSINESNTKVE